MTNAKMTKKALLSSALSLVLCISMLLGTTFAWFTDSVTSANNIIQSGNLDVEMYWADGTKEVPTLGSADWANAATSEPIFNYTNWEPGFTQVRHIQIANEGSLALRYKVHIVANGEMSELTDVIDVYYFDPAAKISTRDDLSEINKIGTLTEVLANLGATALGKLEAGKADTITLAFKMQESAGNEYEDLSIGSFSIELLATQVETESDSFGTDYDSLALYPDGSYRVVAVNGSVEGTAGSSVTYTNENKTIIVKTTAGAEGKVDVVVTPTAPSENVVTIANQNGQNIASYDIQVTGQQDNAETTVSIFLGPLFTGVGAYYNGEEMEGYSYDPATGLVTFAVPTMTTYARSARATTTTIDLVYGSKANSVMVSFEEFVEAKGTSAIHVLGNNIEVTDKIYFGDNTTNTIHLNGKEVTSTSSYVFATQGANCIMTINGDGTVIANTGYAALANKNSTLTINGGTYELGPITQAAHFYTQNSATTIINDGTFISTDADTPILYCINGFIEINGGFFQNTANPNQALLSMGNNLKYANNQKITLRGGTFVNWNPMDSAFARPWTNPDVPALIVLAEGYQMISETQANGDVWYRVVSVEA